MLKRSSRWKLLRTFTRLLAGSHIHQRDVDLYSARRIEIEAEKPLVFFADGEFLTEEPLTEVEVLPAALRLIVPSTHLDHVAQELYVSWAEISGIDSGID